MGGRFKVLILGIDGFTGSHLSKYFTERGFEVHGTALKPNKGSIFKVNVLNNKILNMHSDEKQSYIWVFNALVVIYNVYFIIVTTPVPCFLG